VTVPGVDAEPHLGAFVTVDYELRITEGCLTQDLGLAVDTAFERALTHPIVTAFRAKRLTDPGDGGTVGPHAGSTLRSCSRPACDRVVIHGDETLDASQ